MVLDFSEVPTTQFFYNQIASPYAFATNGLHNQTDVHDMFFNPAKGWSSRYWYQKLTLPKFREPVVERVNFGAFLKFKVSSLNVREVGYSNYGLFHRFKYSGNNVVTKILYSIRKDNWGSSVYLWRSIGGWTSGLATINCATASALTSGRLSGQQSFLPRRPTGGHRGRLHLLRAQRVRGERRHPPRLLGDF